mgnify:CR=1 FL=1
MVKTFDTSRVGGGTYELEQDSSGNYKLKSVGFDQVNKLTLPDLTNLDAPATTTKPEDKKDIADPFKKLADQQQGGGEGGGQDYSAIAPKEAKVKEATVREAGDAMTKIDTGKTDGKFLASGAAGGASLQGDKASDPFLASGAAGGARLPSQVREQKPGMLSTPQQQQETFAARTTGLQDVVTKGKSAVANTVSKILDNSLTVKVVRGISNAITSPEQRANNTENTTALRSGGYVTDFQGKIVGKDGKSVNAADSVFGGMNSRSGFGDISKGAQSRVDTRNSAKTQERISKLSPERQKAFNDKTKDLEKELREHNNERVASREDKSGATGKNKGGFTNPGKGSYGPHSGGGGGGNGGGRVICTDLHRTGELSTKDWIRDTKFTFTTLSKKHVKGYLLWAEPTVKHMQKYPRYRKMWKHIAQHRANDIAWRMKQGKFDLLGRIYAGIGEPLCWVIGNFVSDYNLNKLGVNKQWQK